MAQSNPNEPIHSSPRVNELITALSTLDDLTFDRVMKRCCDPGRPADILKSILNAWNKIQKKKVKLGICDEAMRGTDSGVDFLLGAAKEEQIVAAMTQLHARDYKEVCVASLVMTRPGQLFKSVSLYWREVIKDANSSITVTGAQNGGQKGSSSGTRTAAWANTFNEVVGNGNRKPSVEIIDLDTDSSSSSDGSSIRRRRINRRQSSPSPRRRRRSSRSRPGRVNSRKSRSGHRSSHRRRSSSSSSSDGSTPSKKHEEKTKQNEINNAQPRAQGQAQQSSSSTEGSEAKRYSNQLYQERMALTAEGIWTAGMEKNWIVMEIEETRLTKEFEELGKVLTAFPERHHKYSEEWMAFWVNKSALVEEAGGNAQNYDYIPEWKEHWARRVETLMRTDFNIKLDEIRKKYGMDFDTLNRLRMNKAVMPGTSASASAVASVDPKVPIQILQDLGRSTWRVGSNLENQARVSATPRPVTAPVPAPVPAPEEIDAALIVEGVDGIDLIQVLRRLTLLENELSFLAAKVTEYFQMAELMEATGKGNSNLLLVNHDFLDLLSKCRFKLLALVQANVHPAETLASLKHSAACLDLILQSPKCQALLPQRKRRSSTGVPVAPPPRAAPPSATATRIIPEPPAVDPVPVPAVVAAPPNPRPPGSGPDTSTQAGREEAQAIITRKLERASERKKVIIANLMTAALVTKGRTELTDQELFDFALKAIDPFIRSVEDHIDTPSPPRDMSMSPSPCSHSRSRSRSRSIGSGYANYASASSSSEPECEKSKGRFNRNGKRRNSYSVSPSSSPGDKEEMDEWDEEIESRRMRNIGLALPNLPSCRTRAVTSPPPFEFGSGPVFNYGHTTKRIRVDEGESVAPRRNQHANPRLDGRSGSDRNSSNDSPMPEVGELPPSDGSEISGDLSYKRR